MGLNILYIYNIFLKDLEYLIVKFFLIYRFD